MSSAPNSGPAASGRHQPMPAVDARRDVAGQGIEPERGQALGIELDLAARRLEALLGEIALLEGERRIAGPAQRVEIDVAVAEQEAIERMLVGPGQEIAG